MSEKTKQKKSEVKETKETKVPMPMRTVPVDPMVIRGEALDYWKKKK